jgi:hypothetical protein
MEDRTTGDILVRIGVLSIAFFCTKQACLLPRGSGSCCPWIKPQISQTSHETDWLPHTRADMKSPASPPRRLKRSLAGALLGLLLLQVLSFFFGLTVPLNRVVTLWGKSVDERLALLAPAGHAIKDIADKLPIDARVYIMYPDATIHKNSIYYFYPRTVSITMTDGCYESTYAQWDESPTTEWLMTNHYTHVLNVRQGTLREVQPQNFPGNDIH